MQEEQITSGFSLPDQPFLIQNSSETEPPQVPYQPAPNDPPWGTGMAFLTWGLSVFFLFFFSSVPIIFYAFSQHIDREGLKDFLESPTSILIQISGTIPAHLLTLVFCWFVVTGRGKFSLKQTLGLKWGGFHLGFCILSVIFFYAIFGTLLYYFGDQDTELTRILLSSRAVVWVVAFLAVVTAPVVEELVHRGLLYSALQRSVGVPYAIAITSFIFAAIHFPQYYKSIVALLMISMLSLGLTLIRWKSKNLLPCIVTHLIFNGLQAAGLLLEPYFPKDPATEPVTAFIRSFF